MKRSNAEVLSAFRELYGERFDYSAFEYRGQHIPGIVICRVHGPFNATFHTHRRSEGACDGCRLEKRTSVFVDRVKKHYGAGIDFSLMEYVDNQTPVRLICKHGEFSVYPCNVKQAGGCRFCIGELRRAKQAAAIIDRFRLVHGDRYRYDDFEYSDMHTRGTIKCLNHGDFEMSPANHLSDHGCWKCTANSASKEEDAWVDAIATALGLTPDRRFVPPTKSRAKPTVDAVFGQVALEYDGAYWHSLAGSLKKDMAKTASILKVLPVVIRLRVESEKHGRLPDVAGAINIHIPNRPDPELVRRISDIIRRAAQ